MRTGVTTLSQAFRDTMADVATPVGVVTTIDEGVPHGTTVSAWTSLSMHPPMVMVALDLQSRLLAHVRRTRRLGVNILAAGQATTALAFANKDDDKFAAIPWHVADGLPRLDGTTGWLACDVTEFVAGGDHAIVLGQVIAAERSGSQPLTYRSRGFGTHVPLRVPGQGVITMPDPDGWDHC